MIVVPQIKVKVLNQISPIIYPLVKKVVNGDSVAAVRNLQKEERREGSGVILQNQTCFWIQRLTHLILRVSLILTPVTRLMSATRVMTDRGAERDIIREKHEHGERKHDSRRNKRQRRHARKSRHRSKRFCVTIGSFSLRCVLWSDMHNPFALMPGRKRAALKLRVQVTAILRTMN